MFTQQNLIKFQICCVIIFCSFFASTLFAQAGEDPFAGNYILGRRAQLYLMYHDNSSFPAAYRYDFDIKYHTITDTLLNKNSSCYPSTYDVCAGDFTGNGIDDAVQATVTSAGQLQLQVAGKWVPFDVGLPNAGASIIVPPNVRLIAGNFCGDGKKEFVLSYRGKDNYIHLNLYGLDSSKTIYEIATAQEPFNPDLGSEALYDIAAGDFDRYGSDEIVLIKNNASVKDPNHNEVANINLHIAIYAYKSGSPTLTMGDSINVAKTHKYIWLSNHNANTFVLGMTRLSVAAGNLQGRQNDPCDEFVVGYSIETDYHHRNGLLAPTYLQRDLHPYLLGFYNTVPDTLRFTDALANSDTTYWEIPPVVPDFVPLSESTNPDVSTDFPFTLLCADLDANGTDEIVCTGNASINVISVAGLFGTNSAGGSIDRIKAKSIPINPLKWSSGGIDRQFAVMDLDADTNSCTNTSTGWLPELVILGCTKPWQDQHWDSVYTLKMGISVWGVTKQGYLDSLSNKHDSLGLASFNPSGGSYSMALGDFKGEGLRLGRPRVFVKDSVIQPLAVLSAPPVHFDILNDTTYDVCKAFNGNTSAFNSEYYTDHNTQSIIQTTFHRDWGISASLTAKAIGGGDGVKATLAGRYGNGFSKDSTNENSITVSTRVTANLDDEVLAADVNYKMWEYPVYYRNNLLGHVMVADPTYGQTPTYSWHEGRDWSDPSYVTDHEVGNILSYTAPFVPTDSLQFSAVNTSFSVGPSSNSSSLELKEGEIASSQTTKSDEFGFSFDLFTEVGYEGDIEISGEPGGIGVGVTTHFDFGIEFNNTDVYNQQEIQTSTTTISKTWQLDVNMGNTVPVAGIEYNVKPYVYWSHNGTLILDYVVDPSGIWWQAHYGSKPDLTFILPYLYWTQEGGEFTPGYEYQRYLTKDIFLRPANPSPGDTVGILTRVHNYSLKAIPDTDSVAVRYYLGDPDAGGKEITDLIETGQAMSQKYDVRKPRGETYFYAKWLIPKDISPDARLYAVIDPNNKIDEIHENNNKGYVPLFPGGVTGVKDFVKSEQPKEYRLSQNYPNPFNPVTRINYQIPKFSHVTIKVYNILGQEIATLVNEQKNAGHYSVDFNASDFASGIYFYRMKAGSFVLTKKLILMK